MPGPSPAGRRPPACRTLGRNPTRDRPAPLRERVPGPRRPPPPSAAFADACSGPGVSDALSKACDPTRRPPGRRAEAVGLGYRLRERTAAAGVLMRRDERYGTREATELLAVCLFESFWLNLPSPWSGSGRPRRGLDAASRLGLTRLRRHKAAADEYGQWIQPIVIALELWTPLTALTACGSA